MCNNLQKFFFYQERSFCLFFSENYLFVEKKGYVMRNTILFHTGFALELNSISAILFKACRLEGFRE